MRVLPIVLALSLPGMALAQVTDFKIFPGVNARFDQTCTSFTSRCALGAAGGEYLVEYPMNSKDVNGNATDFFRGIGEGNVPPGNLCQVAGVFYITQDQNCVDQETYDIIIRALNPGTSSGPDTNNATAPIPPGAITLQTPPNGPPSPCAWGITVTLGTAVTVPCASSIFGGTSLANNPAWVANGQSQQGSWHQGGGAAVGDPVAAVASQISWQINPAGVVSQCGTRRVNDFGLQVDCATLNMGNLHADPICSVNPACGHGGLYPSNTVRGDGVALCVRDAAAPDGTGVFSLMSFSALPFNFPLVGILQKSLWIGPSPLIQISFGTSTTLAGRATDTRPFLAPGALVGATGKLWFQSIVFYGGLPLPFTNAASTTLSVN